MVAESPSRSAWRKVSAAAARSEGDRFVDGAGRQAFFDGDPVGTDQLPLSVLVGGGPDLDAPEPGGIGGEVDLGVKSMAAVIVDLQQVSVGLKDLSEDIDTGVAVDQNEDLLVGLGLELEHVHIAGQVEASIGAGNRAK